MTSPLERACALYEERVAAASAAGYASGPRDMASSIGMILSGLDLGDPMSLLRAIHASGRNAAILALDNDLEPDSALYSACVMCFILGALATHAAQVGT